MTEMARTISNIGDLSTDQLKTELARALEVTADNLVWLAKLWRELERRGEDLKELRSGLRNFLPLIADGRLDAQAAVQFAGNLTMLRALSTLPAKEQRRLADGGRVNVVSLRDDRLVTKHMRADEMNAKLIRQVFASGRIRSEDEQRNIVGQIGPELLTPRRPVERVKLDAVKVELWRRVAARRNMSLEEILDAAMRPIIDEEVAADGARGERTAR